MPQDGKEIDALVDTGVAYTSLPGTLLKSLGIPVLGRKTLRLANGQRIEREYGACLIWVVDGWVGTTVLFAQDTSLHAPLTYYDLLLMDKKHKSGIILLTCGGRGGGWDMRVLFLERQDGKVEGVGLPSSLDICNEHKSKYLRPVKREVYEKLWKSLEENEIWKLHDDDFFGGCSDGVGAKILLKKPLTKDSVRKKSFSFCCLGYYHRLMDNNYANVFDSIWKAVYFVWP